MGAAGLLGSALYYVHCCISSNIVWAINFCRYFSVCTLAWKLKSKWTYLFINKTFLLTWPGVIAVKCFKGSRFLITIYQRARSSAVNNQHWVCCCKMSFHFDGKKLETIWCQKLRENKNPRKSSKWNATKEEYWHKNSWNMTASKLQVIRCYVYVHLRSNMYNFFKQISPKKWLLKLRVFTLLQFTMLHLLKPHLVEMPLLLLLFV